MSKDEKHRNHPFFYLFSDIVKTVVHILIIVMGFWYVRTEIPWDDPLHVSKVRDDYHVIEPGDPFTLKFERKVCLNHNNTLVVVIQRRYVPLSEQKITVKAYSDAKYTALPGCETISFSVPIPDDLPVGEYEYIPTAVYKRNFFMEEDSKLLPSVKFRIVR